MTFASHRILVRLLVIAACALLAVPPARAAAPQWLDVGPCSPCITRVVALRPGHPETIFAGTEGNGLFVSHDRGVHWTPIAAAAGLPAQTIIALAFDPQNADTIYLGTDAGLYKSTDGGTQWTAPTSDIGGVILAVAVNPIDSTIVYAGLMFGLYRSTDGGAHFQLLGNPGTASVEKVALVREAPATLLVGVFGRGVHYSLDSGSTWSAGQGIADGNTGQALLVSPLDPALVLAGTVNVFGGTPQRQGLFKSTDGGQNWFPYGAEFSQQAVYALAAGTGRTVYAGTRGNVYVSWGGTGTWEALGTGLPAATVYNLAARADGTVYAATGSGLYTLTTGGQVYMPILVRG